MCLEIDYSTKDTTITTLYDYSFERTRLSSSRGTSDAGVDLKLTGGNHDINSNIMADSNH